MILDLNLIHDSRIQEESISLEELGLSQNKLAQVILTHYEHSCGWKKVYTPCKISLSNVCELKLIIGLEKNLLTFEYAPELYTLNKKSATFYDKRKILVCCWDLQLFEF